MQTLSQMLIRKRALNQHYEREHEPTVQSGDAEAVGSSVIFSRQPAKQHQPAGSTASASAAGFPPSSAWPHRSGCGRSDDRRNMNSSERPRIHLPVLPKMNRRLRKNRLAGGSHSTHTYPPHPLPCAFAYSRSGLRQNRRWTPAAKPEAARRCRQCRESPIFLHNAASTISNDHCSKANAIMTTTPKNRVSL